MTDIRKNFIYQIAYRILTILTPLITSPVLTRALGAEMLGTYSATLAYEAYFSLFALLGVENYGSRTIARIQNDRDARQREFWNIYAVQVLTSLAAITVYTVSVLTFSPERRIIGLIQGIWLISNILDINWFFFGCEQFKKTVTRNLIVKTISVVLIVLLIRKPGDLYLYAAIMSGSAALSQILMWSYLREYVDFVRPEFARMKQHFAPMLRLFVPILAVSVFHIMDKSMLDWLSDDINVGYYYSADKIINIPLGIITAVSAVMLPRISNVLSNESLDRAKILLGKSMELMLFLTASVGFGIAAVAKEFVPWFFGAGFEPCILLVYWFTPILFVKAFSSYVTAQYLIPSNRDRLYTAAVFVGAGVNLIANLILIRRFNALGAVLGTLLAETAVLLTEIIVLRRELPFVRMFMSKSVYVLFGMLMTAAVRALSQKLSAPMTMKVIILIAAGAFLYMCCCMIYWSVKKDSIFSAYLRDFVRRVKHS